MLLRYGVTFHRVELYDIVGYDKVPGELICNGSVRTD